jgi:hypothetical protein
LNVAGARALVAVASATCVLAASGSALAHSVFGDADPAKQSYLLVGPVLMGSTLLCAVCTRSNDSFELGGEISLHRFAAPYSSLFTQLGYGVLAQVQFAGIGADPGPGLHARSALGAQATFGIFGFEAGVYSRLGVQRYSSTAGPFVGAFVSLGFTSIVVQIDIPALHIGSGVPMPANLQLGGLFKFWFPVDWPHASGQKRAR